MTDRKNPKTPKNPEEPDREPPKHKPEGREHQVHKEILERRMRGGKEPTSDDYRRALEQWKNLPGSIVRPPTDVVPQSADQPSAPADEGSSSPSKPDADKKNDGDPLP
jgi:hypothetical protein